MDDDTSTKAQLGVDTGPDSPGCMSEEFAVTNYFADPSHRKKTYNKVLYTIYSSKIAQRLGKYFANWVSQLKKSSIEKMRQYKMIPVFHACGDHSLCNGVEDTFCLAVKA